MSSRYTLTSSSDSIAKRFSVDAPGAYNPTYNAAPTHLLPVIINEGKKGLSFFYWGMTPKMANNRSISSKLISAKSEELTSKASYRNALNSRRCLVPADGYYDWKKVSKKGRTPYWVHFTEQSIFSIAGIWDEYEDEDGEIHHTFRIITVPTNHAVENGDDVMPAILQKEDEKKWIENDIEVDQLLPLLSPYSPEALESHSVSPRVNDPMTNSADLIKHVPPADQFGNYTLFN